jgi:CheY-like chemotaxis protein
MFDFQGGPQGRLLLCVELPIFHMPENFSVKSSHRRAAASDVDVMVDQTRGVLQAETPFVKGNSMKVLIVESDWHFVRQAQRDLESDGHYTLQASPEEAVTQGRRWKPDVVLLAAEFAEPDRLTAMRRLPGRPTVILTEQMARFDRAWMAWQIGGDELLMKPMLHADELRQALYVGRQNALACPTWTGRAASPAISA